MKKAVPVWCFPWSLDHFHNLVRFSNEREIHISRNLKTSQDTWRKGGLCSERPEGESMFF